MKIINKLNPKKQETEAERTGIAHRTGCELLQMREYCVATVEEGR